MPAGRTDRCTDCLADGFTEYHAVSVAHCNAHPLADSIADNSDAHSLSNHVPYHSRADSVANHGGMDCQPQLREGVRRLPVP